MSPHPGQIPAILERAALSRFLSYSLFARTDCESLQRWIHTGNEQDRWSPQVWMGIGGSVLGTLVVAANQPKRRGSRRRYQ